MQSRPPFVAKKKKGKKKKKWRKNEKGRVTERCKVYTLVIRWGTTSVTLGQSEASSWVRRVSLARFELLMHRKLHIISAKASGFLDHRLKRSRPVGFSQQNAPLTSTKSVNNSAQLCAEFEPAPQCARLTLSARKTPGWAFGQNYQVMSSGDQ